jgi:hypothetical protein
VSGCFLSAWGRRELLFWIDRLKNQSVRRSGLMDIAHASGCIVEPKLPSSRRSCEAIDFLGGRDMPLDKPPDFSPRPPKPGLFETWSGPALVIQ